VKGLEKLTPIRLAEVLTQKGAIATEAITDALYAQDKLGEPFAQILVDNGHITEWDLAKIVAEAFQLPFLMPSNYDIDDDAKKKLPKDILFRHQLVPVDVFDSVVVVAMPILTPYEVMSKIQRANEVELFPYVGLASENKKVLTVLFDDYSAWLIEENKRREEANAAPDDEGGPDGGDWTNIFDAGDEAIQQSLKKP